MSLVDRKALRFVRALCGPKTQAIVQDGIYRVSSPFGRPVCLAQSQVQALISNGVLGGTGQRCHAIAETRNWLRRQLSCGDGFKEQHSTERALKAHEPQTGLTKYLAGLGRVGNGTGFLSSHQIATAERVCQWAERARLQQRTTMSYDPTHVSQGKKQTRQFGSISDMAARARKSIADIYRLLPHECAELIVDVCVFEKGLQTIEVERGWPRRSAKLVLRIGLEDLAQKLGIAPIAEGNVATRHRAWRGDGARPTRFE